LLHYAISGSCAVDVCSLDTVIVVMIQSIYLSVLFQACNSGWFVDVPLGDNCYTYGDAVSFANTVAVFASNQQ